MPRNIPQELIDYDNDGIEMLRRVEKESLMGDSGGAFRPPPGYTKPQDVDFIQGGGLL